ncbi:hypothetical protein QBC35DRAFT_477990, partial [Podospora australis]
PRFSPCHIGRMGSRLGYTLGEDDNLEHTGKEVVSGADSYLLDLFLQMTVDEEVATSTGVLTRSCLLVLTLLIGNTDADIDFLRELCPDIKTLFTGRVSMLRNATLLHLVCARKSPAHVLDVFLELADELPRGRNWDLDAMTSNGQTPLMLAVQNEDRESGIVIKRLLARGANAFLRPGDIRNRSRTCSSPAAADGSPESPSTWRVTRQRHTSQRSSLILSGFQPLKWYVRSPQTICAPIARIDPAFTRRDLDNTSLLHRAFLYVTQETAIRRGEVNGREVSLAIIELAVGLFLVLDLIRQGADVNQKPTDDSPSFVELLQAVHKGPDCVLSIVLQRAIRIVEIEGTTGGEAAVVCQTGHVLTALYAKKLSAQNLMRGLLAEVPKKTRQGLPGALFSGKPLSSKCHAFYASQTPGASVTMERPNAFLFLDHWFDKSD